MAIAKKCDRCGVYYENSKDNTYKYEVTEPDPKTGEDVTQEFLINSIRIGNWNQKTKSWVSIGSAYDMCRHCAQEITECIFGKGDIKMRYVKKEKIQKPKKGKKDAGEMGTVVATAEPPAEDVCPAGQNNEEE